MLLLNESGERAALVVFSWVIFIVMVSW